MTVLSSEYEYYNKLLANHDQTSTIVAENAPLCQLN